MANFFISTDSMTRAARASIIAAQEQVARKQIEVASGKVVDLGLALGSRSSEVMAYRHALDVTTAQQGVNAIVGARLESSQAALSEMGKIATGFLDGVLAARGSFVASGQLAGHAQSSFAALAERLNSSIAGEYVFGGLNGCEPPIPDYFAAGGTARAAVLLAFQTRFGISPGDPGTANIAPADMSQFIENEFAGEFTDPAWGLNWSKASEETPSAMIGLAERQDIGASANEAPFRQLMQAMVMVLDLGGMDLSDATRAVIHDKATTLAGTAVNGLASVSSKLGLVQERVGQSNERLSLQIDLVTRQVGSLEDVDTFKTATELNRLMLQLEATYATTARIQSLNLLDYLR